MFPLNFPMKSEFHTFFRQRQMDIGDEEALERVTGTEAMVFRMVGVSSDFMGKYEMKFAKNWEYCLVVHPTY